MADRPRINQQARPANPPQNAPMQPQPAQQPLPNRPAAAPFVAPVHPLFARTPPQYKSGTDLDIYLQRFRAFARATNCPIAEQGNLLLSLLDDKALYGVCRIFGQGNVVLEELVVQLRRAEGLNSERYVAELRNRKRLKNEPIWEFHLDLHNLAKKAYPANDAMRQGSLRQTFIANINEPYIASRLRELPHLDMEELLDTAIMLYGCQTASVKSVNAICSRSELENSAIPEQRDEMTQMTQGLQNLGLDSTAELYDAVPEPWKLPGQLTAEDLSTLLDSDTHGPDYGYDDPYQEFFFAHEDHEDQTLDLTESPTLDYPWMCLDPYAEQSGTYTYPW